VPTKSKLNNVMKYTLDSDWSSRFINPVQMRNPHSLSSDKSYLYTQPVQPGRFPGILRQARPTPIVQHDVVDAPFRVDGSAPAFSNKRSREYDDDISL
jgi:hypothetical protein